MDEEITLPSRHDLTRTDKIGLHSHRKLGRNDNYVARENTDGLIGQLRAKKAAGISNRPKPLQVSTNTRIGLKPKPLQISTNTIHNQTVKKPQQSISEKKTTKASDENDVKVSVENDAKVSVENAYNPLKDVYLFDDELYKIVCKLELADDGLPSYQCDEPFDF